MKIIFLLIMISLFVFSLKELFYLHLLSLYEKYGKGKHYCWKCDTAYIFTKKTRKWTHCAECGTELIVWGAPIDEVLVPVFEEFDTKESK